MFLGDFRVLFGAIIGTCDIWDTDYHTGLMTVFVSWQLIVALDSIRNSCDVFTMCNEIRELNSKIRKHFFEILDVWHFVSYHAGCICVFYFCICVIVYLYSLATDWPGSGYLLTVSVASVKQIVIIIIKCPFGCRHQRLPYLGVLHTITQVHKYTITRHKYANTQIQRRSIEHDDAVQHFCVFAQSVFEIKYS